MDLLFDSIPRLPVIAGVELGLMWKNGDKQISRKDLAVIRAFPDLRSLRVQIRRLARSELSPEHLQPFQILLQEKNHEDLEIDVS